MNTSLICLIAVISANPLDSEIDSVFRPTGNSIVVRGQTPSFETIPQDGPNFGTPGTTQTVIPPTTSYYQPPMSPQTPYDPFSNPTQFPQSPFGVQDPLAQNAPLSTYGANGSQPYRFGWKSKYDFTYLAPESTERDLGDFSAFEFDAEWAYTYNKHWGWIEKITPQFGLRNWDGPTSGVISPTTALPGNAYRFGLDLELSTPANGPWSYQLGFTPSINSDFANSLSSNAWQFDGRGIIFYRPAPQIMYAFGAAYWDRVDDRVVPIAGLVWTPDSIWEFRLIFPEPRISVFLGNVWGAATWFYARAAYNVEAYEIQARGGGREQVELEDWRATLGFRQDNGYTTAFIEAGWAFGRDVDFDNGTRGFSIDTGFIARAGLRF